MRTELIEKKTIRYEYNEEMTEYDVYEYICPCGKGKIVIIAVFFLVKCFSSPSVLASA